MTIRALLLGSAAALVAVSGARAADAVVMAEPEPMEYVRICDVYGTGFYYVPGTETCLKIGGYIRADIRGGELFDFPRDSYNWLTRFTITTDARTETELGTLRSFTETRFNYSNGGNDVGNFELPGAGDIDLADTGVSLNFAYVELAGFRIGKGESAFTVFPGYGGNVINDDVIPFGPYDTNFLQYEADFGGGFSGIISAEEGDRNDELVSYRPHVVGGLKYTSALVDIAGVAAYDANNEEFAGKVRLDIKPSETFYGFIMGGYKTDDGDVEDVGLGTSDGSNYFGNWQGGDCDDDIVGVNGGNNTCGDGFAVWGGLSYVFSPQVTLNGAVSYDEGENFYTTAQVNFKPVEGLSIQPEISYFDNFDDDRVVHRGHTTDDESGIWGGTLRVQRDF